MILYVSEKSVKKTA